MRTLTSLELALIAGGASSDSIVVTGTGSPPDFNDGPKGSGDGSGGDSGSGGTGDGAAPDPNRSCGGQLSYDNDFISRSEGGQQKTAYVPKSGDSGVTIATGVDLGQHELREIRAAIDKVYNQHPVNNAYPGFESNRRAAYQTLNSLQPYMGLKGDAAAQMLKAHPLSVSTAFANVLDLGIQQIRDDTVIAHFNRDSGHSFVNLPPNVQTVILSVAHQYGNNLGSPKATPNFWNQVTRGDWKAAYNNLMDFGDKYPTRRQAEAALLKKAIDAGLSGLPNC